METSNHVQSGSVHGCLWLVNQQPGILQSKKELATIHEPLVAGSTVSSGDSGSGLTFQFEDRWYLRGVTSVGPGPTVPGLVGYPAFTDVDRYKLWLLKVFADAEEREKNEEENNWISKIDIRSHTDDI